MASVYHISIPSLILALLPIAGVILICLLWKLNLKSFLYASGRMVLQLFLIGFFLLYIFKSQNPMAIGAVVLVMFTVAAWIALRPIKGKRRPYYPRAFFSLLLGGGPVLALVVWGVIRLDPWYEPRYVIPLAGMIFANAMNGLSLAAERFEAERVRRTPYEDARRIAFETAMLPITNNFLAVGLVALPGMMTGQILSGVSPLIAARYQIMVMSMVFGSIGISSAFFLYSFKIWKHDL